MARTASGLSPRVLGNMNGQIERASTVAEAKRIVDMANTAVEACRRTRRSIAETNTYAEVALRATIKAGELLAGLERRPEGRPSNSATVAEFPWNRAIEDADIPERTARSWESTARKADELSTYLDSLGQDDTPTWRGFVGFGAHVGANSGDNEWYTPGDYISAVVDVMGGIDLDPASTPEANEIVGAAKIYTATDDGLGHGWGGRVFMNPPYARPLVDGFCAKLAEEYAAGNVSQAITLTNNGTETGWFHALAEVGQAICFPRGRVKFWHPRKEAVPLQGQALFYLGPEVEAFQREFVRFGFVAVL